MKTVIIILLVSFNLVVRCQNELPVFHEVNIIDTAKQQKLYIDIDNCNFFRNNEYFGDFVKGYTLIGYYLEPKLVFYPTRNTKIETGVHLLKYSGLDNYSKSLPTLRFHYTINSNINIIMGTIYGSANHRLIEPLMSFEKCFTNHTENGLQFLFDFKHLRSDLWLCWEQFIFDKSPVQEELMIATNSELLLTQPEAKFQISVPLQFIYTHKGGQIDTVDAPLQSQTNLATGINLKYSFASGYVNSVSFRNFLIFYNDISFTKQQAFASGHANYHCFTLEAKPFVLEAAYWNAHNFIAPRGEALYQSVSHFNSSFTQANRSLLVGKLFFVKQIGGGVTLTTGVETYYDLKTSQLNYNYSVYIRFCRDFPFIHAKK